MPTTSQLPPRSKYPAHVTVPDAARASGMMRYNVARLVCQNPRRFGAVKVTGQLRGLPLYSPRNFAHARWLWVISPAGVEKLRKEQARITKRRAAREAEKGR